MVGRGLSVAAFGPAPAVTARLTNAQARRIALAAQGFGYPRPQGPVGVRQLTALINRLGVVQIDSVNVLARAHYLPAFSRLGPYPSGLLDHLAYAPRRRLLFEYWAHEASLIPLSLQPCLRWRMERAQDGQGIYGGLAKFAKENAGFIAGVLAEVEERGPIAASELALGGKGAGGWWGWSEGKRALEFLFWCGALTTALRRPTFERVYDLPERVLPRPVLDTPTPPADVAQRRLVRHAARALGIATASDLRDFFRLDALDTRARLAELVEAGDLLPVAVEGWKRPAFLDPAARRPRRIDACALLSPFDPLVWERERTARLFGFRLRLEIYTPAHKRVHGYYVLPFLLGENLVARVDLKAERAAGCLHVLAAHAEPGRAPAEIAPPLLGELHAMAAWLGLDHLVVGNRGDLATVLARALANTDRPLATT